MNSTSTCWAFTGAGVEVGVEFIETRSLLSVEREAAGEGEGEDGLLDD
jgi:hypothetical protein